MLIDTRAIGFALTDALAGHVEFRLRAALDPFAGNVLKVTVRLDDVNASRGGIDKRCTIVAALRRRGVVIAEATHENLYVAVDEAATRIRRSLKRARTRRVSLQRKDAQRPGALVTI